MTGIGSNYLGGTNGITSSGYRHKPAPYSGAIGIHSSKPERDALQISSNLKNNGLFSYKTESDLYKETVSSPNTKIADILGKGNKIPNTVSGLNFGSGGLTQSKMKEDIVQRGGVTGNLYGLGGHTTSHSIAVSHLNNKIGVPGLGIAQPRDSVDDDEMNPRSFQQVESRLKEAGIGIGRTGRDPMKKKKKNIQKISFGDN